MIRVLCPAKLNLFLAVGPRDARGWHPVRTVMQAISLADELEIERSNETEVVFDGMSVPIENSVRSAVGFLREVGDFPSVRVRVTKRIPIESGFGGGSSDGAGVLRAAPLLMRSPPSEHEARAIARALGTDAAFFTVGGLARGEGYGERIAALPDARRRWFVLARPPVGCSTPAMYGALDEETYDFAAVPSDETLRNDFERVMPAACGELLGELRGRGLPAGLTGSGSAVFGCCGDEAEAERIAGELRAPWVRVARSLTRAESLRIETV